MDKTINFSPSPETNKIAKLKRKRNSQPPTKKRPVNQSRKEQPKCFKRKLLLTSIEILSLITIAFCLIIMLLGYSASKFSGTGFFSSLLPFAGGILIFILLGCIFLIAWWKLRKRLQNNSELSSPTLSLFLAIVAALLINHDQFTLAYGNFRTLIGGKEEIGRITVAHQIYAAYRRQNASQLEKMINRSFVYRPAVEDAARSFNVDINLLQGIIATESSFIPRNSSDGGRGLFQITQVPQIAMIQASKKLGTEKISLDNPRHNAFVGAATFKHYLTEMKGDLFLALLAYNIGPANGGLRSIVQNYGATDFTTIQPYLQTLPRDYPIRVLSYSLAFRLWQEKGKLLAYEEGNNAIQIQKIGIPGLNTGL
ncbi:MAG: transglycosylase [Nitrosomonas sp.]|nr:MAG: transglycosylase [Nitrosomonas sp.]